MILKAAGIADGEEIPAETAFTGSGEYEWDHFTGNGFLQKSSQTGPNSGGIHQDTARFPIPIEVPDHFIQFRLTGSDPDLPIHHTVDRTRYLIIELGLRLDFDDGECSRVMIHCFFGCAIV